MRDRDDVRVHYYLVRCAKCVFIQHYDMRPIAAQRAMDRHARLHPGHNVYVVDVTAVAVVHRACFEELSCGDDPPF